MSKDRTFEPSRNLLGLGSHPFVTQAPLGSDNPRTCLAAHGDNQTISDAMTTIAR